MLQNIQKIKIKENEIEVYDNKKSDRQVIIFAHGLGSNLRQWEHQINYFKIKYRVIAFSLQGHGQSSFIQQNDKYSIESYIHTINLLVKELSITNCIWVGNSMGGVLGYAMIKLNPDFIKILITNGTTPELKMSSMALKSIYYVDKIMIKFMGFDNYIKFAANHSTKYKDVKIIMYQLFKYTSPDVIITNHQILGNYSYIDVINNTTTPICIIKSPNDKDINKFLKIYEKHLLYRENTNIIELDNTGHICNLEQPKKYNEIIDNFISYCK